MFLGTPQCFRHGAACGILWIYQRRSWPCPPIKIRLYRLASSVDIVSPAANEGGLEQGRSKPRIRGAIRKVALRVTALLTGRKSDRGRDGEIGQERRRGRCFLSNGVRIVVGPVALSSYSASQTFHTTGFPLEKRRRRGYARRSWHSTGSKRCYRVVVFVS